MGSPSSVPLRQIDSDANPGTGGSVVDDSLPICDSGHINLFGGAREAANQQKGVRIKYGTDIERDERLKSLLRRENFFLTVVIPQNRPWGAAFADWSHRSRRPEVYIPVLVAFAMHFGLASYCSTRGEFDTGICAGGPTNLQQEPIAYLSFGGDYGPPILNSLAVLMLSFYANTCLGLYKEAYVACQDLKQSIVELMTIVVGTIHPYDDDGVESRFNIRMEFWRCVNLFHLCTYVLSDKTRATYSFEGFLVPVADAFGEWDGVEKLGMLRRKELSAIAATNEFERTVRRGSLAGLAKRAKATARNVPAAVSSCARSTATRRASTNSPHAVGTPAARRAARNASPTGDSQRTGPGKGHGTGHGMDHETHLFAASHHRDVPHGDVPHGDPPHSDALHGAAPRAPRPAGGGRVYSRRRSAAPGLDACARPSTESRLSAVDSVAAQRLHLRPTLANSRGDVQSKTAAMHAALGVRLYLLTEFVLDQKLSRASWPAWNSVLLNVRRASEKMKQQALFRLPRVYRFSVKYLVASALLTDTFILGARAGRMLVFARGTAEWSTHVYFGALVGLALNMLAVYLVSLLVQGLSIMEIPFASDTLDMPGLSYVSAAAETSLRMVTCRSEGNGSIHDGDRDGGAHGGAHGAHGGAHTPEAPDIMDMMQQLHADELVDMNDLADEQGLAQVSAPLSKTPLAPEGHRRRRRSVRSVPSADVIAGHTVAAPAALGSPSVASTPTAEDLLRRQHTKAVLVAARLRSRIARKANHARDEEEEEDGGD